MGTSVSMAQGRSDKTNLMVMAPNLVSLRYTMLAVAKLPCTSKCFTMITARIHVAYSRVLRKLTDWPRGKVFVDLSSIRATEVDCICLAKE
jgi:hypothetical protein